MKKGQKKIDLLKYFFPIIIIISSFFLYLNFQFLVQNPIIFVLIPIWTISLSFAFSKKNIRKERIFTWLILITFLVIYFNFYASPFIIFAATPNPSPPSVSHSPEPQKGGSSITFSSNAQPGAAGELIKLLICKNNTAGCVLNTQWGYRRSITINNTQNSNTLTDYQVNVTLNTASLISAGKMRSDCGDIRFTDSDGNIPLSYWIESGCNTTNTKFWVKVPSIPASSTKTIYVYYGNPSATSVSTTVNTFIREIDGVIGSWNFNEGSGTVAADSSGNGNSGTLYSGTTVCSNPPTAGCPTWVDGKFRKALSFDGVDDYVNTPLLQNNVTAYTIEVWAKTSDASGWKAFVQDRGAANSGGKSLTLSLHAVTAGDGRVRFMVDSDFLTLGVYSNPINDNQWHHIVGTWSTPAGQAISPSHFKLYIDGIYAVVGTQSGSATSPLTGVGGTKIARHDAWNSNLKGVIDEVRIYNRNLTEQEISDLYNNYGYTTPNYPRKVLVRKFSSPEPTTSFGNEEILPQWAYRRPITISNTQNNTLTDYQVNVIFNTASLISSGKMRSDCGDIRFTDSDGITLLNYWLESGCNTTSTKIWVKVPSIPSGSKTIYVYYGNPSATSQSNGGATFIFFDDFSGSSIDTTKWSSINSVCSLDTTNHWLKCYTSGPTSGGFDSSSVTLPTFDNFMVEFKWDMFLGSGAEGGRIYVKKNANNWYLLEMADGNGVGPDIIKNVGGTQTKLYDGTTDHDGWGPGVVRFYYNGSNLTADIYSTTYSVSDSSLSGFSSITITHIDGSTAYSSETHWDDFKIRKYTSPEPTTSVGAEFILTSNFIYNQSSAVSSSPSATYTCSSCQYSNNTYYGVAYSVNESVWTAFTGAQTFTCKMVASQSGSCICTNNTQCYNPCNTSWGTYYDGYCYNSKCYDAIPGSAFGLTQSCLAGTILDHETSSQRYANVNGRLYYCKGSDNSVSPYPFVFSISPGSLAGNCKCLSNGNWACPTGIIPIRGGRIKIV
jgi:hypothetical protein